MRVNRCSGNHCKPNDEIDSRLDVMTMYFYQNNQNYNPNSYDDQVVQNFLSKHIYVFNRELKDLVGLRIQMCEISSEQNLFDLGFLEEKRTYNSVSENTK